LGVLERDTFLLRGFIALVNDETRVRGTAIYVNSLD
jgi:hypothetical protein